MRLQQIQCRPIPRLYEKGAKRTPFVVMASRAGARLGSGAYFLAAVDGGAFPEPAQLRAGLAEGAYASRVIDGGAFPHRADVSASLGSGVYFVAAVDGGAAAESARLSVSLSGNYELRAVRAVAPQQPAKLAAAILSGVYA